MPVTRSAAAAAAAAPTPYPLETPGAGSSSMAQTTTSPSQRRLRKPRPTATEKKHAPWLNYPSHIADPDAIPPLYAPHVPPTFERVIPPLPIPTEDGEVTRQRRKRKYSKNAEKMYRRTGASLFKLGERLNKGTESITIPYDPDLFLVAPQDNDKCRDIMEEAMPDYQALEGFTEVPPDGDFTIRVDRAKTLHPDWPTDILASRVDAVFGEAENERLCEAMRLLKATCPKYYHKDRKARVDDPCADVNLHLGFWRWMNLYVTLSTETHNQSPATIAAIDHLLAEVNKIIGLPSLPLLRRRASKLATQREVILKDLYADPVIAEMIKKRPALKQEAFPCLACKEGRSGLGHCDLHDDPYQLTTLAVAGQFTGGYIVFPQLKMMIPLRPGQLLFIRSRYLFHFATPYEGTRYIFTGFFCHNIGQDASEILTNKMDPMDDREEGEL